jgi:hypothetical protein
MAKKIGIWGRFGLVVLVAFILAGCTLGQQAPSEPLEQQPLDVGVEPAGDGEQPAEQGGAVVGPTQTPLIEIPPTNTPEPALLPEEQIQTITVEGDTHRTQEAVTVRVKRGKSVANLTCSWVLQDTGQTVALGTPTTNQLDENTFEDVFLFTPEAAGTYAVNCSAVATTMSGQRAVSLAGTPFAVEAKGGGSS